MSTPAKSALNMRRRMVRDIVDPLRDHAVVDVRQDLEELRMALGSEAAWARREVPAGHLADAEFQVFSQWNEDGIIQHILRHSEIDEPSFVEFGVESYKEANTRFLLRHDNWRGLIMDVAPGLREGLETDEIMWKYDLHPLTALISAENIDEILVDAGFSGELGLLSIDVDGVDYWIWKAITTTRPQIVVCEYNATLGPTAAVTVPYDPEFRAEVAHPSRLYYGASLAALCTVAEDKGYRFVGCESHGTNAFFLRSDIRSQLPTVSCQAGYRPSRYRSSRGEDGRLTYISDLQDRLRLIADQPLEDVADGSLTTVGARLL